MPTNNPTMFDTHVGFAGIELQVDPINRKRTDGSDNVMAIFHEEQPFTWEFSQPFIAQALRQSSGDIDFLDIGCGSGVFALLVARHFPTRRIIALDKSVRAIQQARENAKLNQLSFELKQELYGVPSFPERSAKVIGLYPPYHLYPETIALSIPQHARGGSDGQQEFKNQLTIANHHLAEQGLIFINQMCLGTQKGPDFLDYIPELVEGSPSVLYTNVFPRISTHEFLSGVYGAKHPEYVAATSAKNPWLYYCVAIVRRDGRGEQKEVPHKVDLKGRTWQDRILLHQEIAQHEYK